MEKSTQRGSVIHYSRKAISYKIKSHNKMMKAGADAVVSPTYIGGMRMVSEMIRPAVVIYLDMMLRERKKVLRFEELPVDKDSSFVGKTVVECKIREKTGALLVAIKERETGEYHFNPTEATKIKDGDILILIASPEMLIDMEKRV